MKITRRIGANHLTNEQILQIYRLSERGVSKEVISKKFGMIHPSTLRRILKGKAHNELFHHFNGFPKQPDRETIVKMLEKKIIDFEIEYRSVFSTHRMLLEDLRKQRTYLMKDQRNKKSEK